MTKYLKIAAGISALMACYVLYADAPAAPQTIQDKTEAAKEQPQEVNITKISEAFGHFIGRNLQAPGVKFDVDSLIKGIRDGVAGKPSPMSDEDYEAAMLSLQEKAFNQLSEDNLKAAAAFLDQNTKQQNVVIVVPNKLQYLILQEGKGAVVGDQDAPLIQYTGKFLDGKVFGSSEEVGGPITVPLNQTIPGFSKGIAGMKEGEKRRIFVHPDMGYGTSGQLPPNALLIFDVEVVKANTKDASASNEEDNFLPLALGDDQEIPENDSDDEDDDDTESEDNANKLSANTPTMHLGAI